MVTLEDRTGVVEEIELRVTKIRDSKGDLHIIPNGEIKKVTNHSRGNKTVVVDIPLPYRVDVTKFLKRRTKFAEVFRKNLTL